MDTLIPFPVQRYGAYFEQQGLDKEELCVDPNFGVKVV